MKNNVLFLLYFLFSLSVFSKGSVKVFVSLTPAGDFVAKSTKVKGKVSKNGDSYTAKLLKVRVKSLKTGVDLRDKHLHKRLTKKKGLSNVEVTNAKGKAGKGSATINVNGIKKKVKFTFKDMGKVAKINFKLSLKMFKIASIKYMGIGVDDIVKVSAEVPIK